MFSNVRVFLGMVHHLSKFAEHLADKTTPIRDPMQNDRQWVWGTLTLQQKAFEEMKSILKAAPVYLLSMILTKTPEFQQTNHYLDWNE